MKFSVCISAAALLATSVVAHPIEKRAITDVDILQYALTVSQP